MKKRLRLVDPLAMPLRAKSYSLPIVHASIGLGTVQLGVPYGNASNNPLISEEQAFEILDEAHSSDLRLWDTAAAYGLSEERIGKYFKSRQPNGIVVSTKIPAVDAQIWRDYAKYQDFVRQSVRSSCSRLGVGQLGLLQFHQCEIDFLSSRTFAKICDFIHAESLATSIGVSVYEPIQAEAALECALVKSLQVPLNVADWRFVENNFLKKCKMRGIKIIVRSIFLQGVLVEVAALPSVAVQSKLVKLRQDLAAISSQYQLSLQEAAIAFVFANLGDVVDVGLVAANNRQELATTIAKVRQTRLLSPELYQKFYDYYRANMASSPIDPRQWN